jgi:hypothetical protein
MIYFGKPVSAFPDHALNVFGILRMTNEVLPMRSQRTG